MIGRVQVWRVKVGGRLLADAACGGERGLLVNSPGEKQTAKNMTAL